MKLISLSMGPLSPSERNIINQVLMAAWWTNPILNPQAGQVEPFNKAEGMIAYANGVEWDPGSGAGIYYYTGAAWTKL